MKIVERFDLKPDDVIGVGCSEISFTGPEEELPVKKEEMFVYRLIKKTDISIEISDDDDDIVGDKNVKSMISNGIVKMEPVESTTNANRLVTNSSSRRNNGMLVFHIKFTGFIFFLLPSKCEHLKGILQNQLQHRARPPTTLLPIFQQVQLHTMKIQTTMN